MSEENRSALDRELFSELIESPIHPLLINMVRPYVDSCDQKFRLQINGEALWRWREVRKKPSIAFEVLHASISHLGYKLEESARDRVGRAIATNIQNFWRKIDGISNSKNRKRVRASKWVTTSFMPNEIMLSPSDVVSQLKEENGHLRETVEEKAAELYWSMKKSLALRGKDFVGVGKKQQQRHLEQIQSHEQEKQRMGAVSDKDKEIEELKDRLRHADTEIVELESRNGDLMQNVEATKKQLVEQTERLERLSQESSAALDNKNKDIEQFKSRIASLSEKRVKQDQSKVEDTLSMNRQSKIEEDYNNFFDEARMDACEEMQSFLRLHEEIYVHINIPRLACLIFETAFERMEEAKEAAITFCKDVYRSMIESATEMSRRVMFSKERRQRLTVNITIGFTGQELPYPRDVLDGVMLALKETAQTCDLDMFVEDVKDAVFKKWNNWCQMARLNEFRASRHLLKNDKIISYLKNCLRLTWRMVTQVPAMSIEYNSRYLDKHHRKLGYHSHPDMQATTSAGKAPGEEIACYLWPGLLDGNGRLIRAGEVLCKMHKEC